MTRVIVLVFLCLSPALRAQTTFTAPPGYLTKSGGIYSQMWGSYRNARIQMIDRTMPKAKLQVTRLEYRTQTHSAYNTWRGMGRTWTRATLHLARCNCSNVTTTLSKNYLGTPTLVYAAKTSLPSYTSGKPTQVWGNAGSFTFSKAFSYDGAGSLLMDWDFRGGTFANGWTGNLGPYYIDGPYFSNLTINLTPSNNTAREKFLPNRPRTSPTCTDSGHSTRDDAYALLQAQILGDNWPHEPWAGRVRVHTAVTYYTAKNAPVIATLTAGGSDTGAAIAGAKCRRLYVNMGFPLIISTKTASSFSGIASRHISSSVWTPYSDSWAGTRVCFQGAWEDSKTKQLALTIASRFVLPKKPVYPKFGMAAYHEYDSKGNPGRTLAYASLETNALERFTTK